MILLFLIVRRTPTIRELIVATPLSLSSPSATGLSAHAPAHRLERSDFVHCTLACSCRSLYFGLFQILPLPAQSRRSNNLSIGSRRKSCPPWGRTRPSFRTSKPSNKVARV
jgi:hypothetical protein